MAVQISGNDITVPRDGSFTRNVTIGGTLTYEDVTNIDSVGLITARTGIEIGARPGVAASISVDGNMIVSGVTTLGGEVQIPDYIHHVGDNNCKFGFESGDTFAVETAGSERVRITSGGSLLVGKTAGTMATAGTRIDPQTTLITGSSTSTNLATASGAALALINNSATDNNFSNIGGYNSNSLVTSQINFVNTDISSRHGAIAFMVHNGSSMPEMMRITKDGNLGIGTITPSGLFHTHAASGTNRNYIEASASHAFLRLKGGSTSHNTGLEFYSGSSNIANVSAIGSGGLAFEVGGSERIRISSAGAIGIAGANYGTSGQVITSQGSGSAVQWATPASATSGTYTSVGTGYYKDITTTSTNVIRYDIMFTGVSIGGGMDWQFQLGDSGGVEGSGYEVVASYRSHNSSNNTNNRSDAFRWHGTGSGSFIMDGRFSLIRIHNNKWFGEGLLVRTEAGSTIYDMVGTKELSGALTTIRISSSYDDSEVFDGGHYKVIEHTGTV